MTGPFPRCLFTQVGMESCPGYRAHRVTERPSRWLLLPIPSHVTCAHLRVQATERGLVAACGHPLGQATAWWDAA